MYKRLGKKQMTYKAFRVKLVSERLAAKHLPKPQLTVARKAQSLDGKLHLMGRDVKMHCCHVCYKKKQRKETVYFCKTCAENPVLHPDTSASRFTINWMTIAKKTKVFITDLYSLRAFSLTIFVVFFNSLK